MIFAIHIYRVNQQCCPVGRGSPDILAKSLANPDKIFIFLKILSAFASDLAKKSGNPCGGTPHDFRRDNIDGSHGMPFNIMLNSESISRDQHL